jgi:hypothetical protein
MAVSSCNRALTLHRLAIALLVILGIYLFRDSWKPAESRYNVAIPATQPDTEQPHIPAKDSSHIAETHAENCRNVPGADNVLVMLKTGATEIYEKLPTHFVTLFKCTPHYMVFSDLAQDYADFPIRDAIAPVSKQFREHHEDFTLYRKLQQYQRDGQDTSELKGDGSWNLDKWKFLPMLFEAFENAPPQVEWFVMMEADTSVSWANLLQWLKTMDSNVPYYLGSQNTIGDTTFAHGGSGIILSRQAARQLQQKRDEEGKEAYNRRWEEETAASCCGDEIVARTLLEADVPLTMAWPMIQGETVATIDFTKNHWCTPAITWHHVTPLEIDTLWQFQSDWVDDHDWNTPYLYRDVFSHFIERHISATRRAWNNMSQDKKLVAPSLATAEDVPFAGLKDFEKRAIESENACEEACIKQPHGKCIQWMFTPGRCYLGRVIRFGKADERESESWVSGWVSERVATYKKRMGNCKKVHWSGA